MPSQESEKVTIHPIQRRDNYICRYCGKDGLASLDNWHDCTIDHVIPRKYGGSDDESNLVTCCGYCNAIKGERLFESIDAAREYIMNRLRELEVDYKKVVAEVRGQI